MVIFNLNNACLLPCFVLVNHILPHGFYAVIKYHYHRHNKKQSEEQNEQYEPVFFKHVFPEFHCMKQKLSSTLISCCDCFICLKYYW
jgi:hypothetical protein